MDVKIWNLQAGGTGSGTADFTTNMVAYTPNANGILVKEISLRAGVQLSTGPFIRDLISLLIINGVNDSINQEPGGAIAYDPAVFNNLDFQYAFTPEMNFEKVDLVLKPSVVYTFTVSSLFNQIINVADTTAIYLSLKFQQL